jgi:hypothetical protein
MNFRNKTESVSLGAWYPSLFPFVTFRGKSRDEGWTKDLGFGGEKRENKGRIDNFHFIS